MSRYTHVHKEEHVPLGEGWVILEFSSVYVPEGGMRALPKHRYPAYYHSLTLVLYFEDAPTWEEAIRERLERQQKFVALRVQRPSIKQTVQIDIERGS